MRFVNLVAILAFGRISAEVSDAVAPNLRGSEPEVNEDRDLISISGGSSASYSKSVSFSFYSCYPGTACFDMYTKCIECSGTDSFTATYGNSVAESEFCAATLCLALADAYACSVGCVKAKGSIDLNAKSDSTNGMDLNLKMKLKQATMTVAKASSRAAAATISAAGGYVFTGTESDYCGALGKGTVFCDPNIAATLTKVDALAFGDAYAMADASAASGASSKIAAWVDAQGPNVNQISAYVTTVAQTFAFASASTTALAQSLAAVCADAVAISAQCSSSYNKYCSTGECGYPDEQSACSAAVAFAQGAAASYSAACASAAAAAFADTKVCMTFGGTLGGFKNDGSKMKLEFSNGGTCAYGAAAAICPRK
jgi:hypothetical protein